MKIGIIGGGAIGLLFAAYLQKGHDVTLYVRSAEQKKLISSYGISLLAEGREHVSYVQVLLTDEWKGGEELSIVAVKQYDIHPLISIINDNQAATSSSFLFLQNGMGHLSLLHELRAKSILVGTVEHGALKKDARTVQHTGAGRTNIAVFSGGGTEATECLEETSGDFPFSVRKDYKEMLLQKLVINAVVNPLTGILQVKNGELIENPFYYIVVQKYFAEIAAVLELSDPEETFDALVSVCRKTSSNTSSMLKDLQNQRQTEADAILGYILGEADKKNKQAPLVHAFYSCIKGKEPGN
ncbi:2-dehydropantoate 2-reductase [Bacillus infantis]|uniref:2-dehydropantoate 2-reductase n=1 Tax=Bacillus infantis TaxID=324767 RepID=UPI003CE68FAD